MSRVWPACPWGQALGAYLLSHSSCPDHPSRSPSIVDEEEAALERLARSALLVGFTDTPVWHNGRRMESVFQVRRCPSNCSGHPSLCSS